MAQRETAPEKIDDLNGAKKAAILLVALGTQTSSKIFKNLSTDEVEQISQEISRLENISASLLQEVGQEFYQMIQAQKYIAAGGMEYAEEVLKEAMGFQKAESILTRIRRSLEVKGFNVLKEVDPTQLLNFIQKEHPQTIALVLTQIDPEQAASIVADLPIELQQEVLYRFATMDSVTQDMVKQVEQILESRIDFSQGGEKLGGVKPAADILNMLGRSAEKKILESIAEEDAELATDIKNLMFVFEDIVMLDDRSIQRVLKEIDTDDLTLALKAVNDDVKDRVLQNMSQRASDMILEEMEFMGPVRLSEVESAQRKIVEAILRLDEEGEIVISSGSVGDEIVE